MISASDLSDHLGDLDVDRLRRTAAGVGDRVIDHAPELAGHVAGTVAELAGDVAATGTDLAQAGLASTSSIARRSIRVVRRHPRIAGIAVALLVIGLAGAVARRRARGPAEVVELPDQAAA